MSTFAGAVATGAAAAAGVASAAGAAAGVASAAAASAAAASAGDSGITGSFTLVISGVAGVASGVATTTSFSFPGCILTSLVVTPDKSTLLI